ncbi:unnamed protein product [Linum tenue]|uniref:CCHC-type domain-containing protein n=1 Tax=Linum tenue TaxID=586396 RepID=A0AAV0LAG4_9ROSI|nr:unnamed protein product [Linum tenue]
MIVWVQLPALKVHFYHREVLMTIGNLIGRTIKLDYHTLNRQRRKFARLAVEVDMSKPLVPRIFLDDHWQRVEYENLPEVCFECGKIGHNTGVCQRLRPADTTTNLVAAGGEGPAKQRTVAEEPSPGFGPWMLVSKRSRRNPRDPVKQGKQEGDLGYGGQISKNGKGGAKSKEGGAPLLAPVVTISTDNHRAQGQERKVNQAKKEGGASASLGKANGKGKEEGFNSSSLGKTNGKGKEVQHISTGLNQSLLGPGPSQEFNRKGEFRPAVETNQASTSGLPSSTSSPKAMWTDPGLTLPRASSPKELAATAEASTEVQTLVGLNGTKMQIFTVASADKMKGRSEVTSMSAGERTKHKKISKRQTKKGSPVKLHPSKALQVWTPVKDRKTKSRSRLATLTLQEISAWTEAAGKSEGTSGQGVPTMGAPGMANCSP